MGTSIVLTAFAETQSDQKIAPPLGNVTPLTSARVGSEIKFDLLTDDVQDQKRMHDRKGDVSFALIDVHVGTGNGYWIVGRVLV